MKALGLNIIGLSDFHGDLHANDPGPLRFKDQKDYFEATRRASDTDFLVTPWEEPSAFFGGHYNIMFPKRNVYWSKVRQPGQPFTENDPVYGKVYHTGSAEDVQQMMDAEGAYWYHAHPRTKGTTGYPDLIFDKPYEERSLSGRRVQAGHGAWTCRRHGCASGGASTSIDTMNNLYAGSGLRPKYIIADIDTYKKGPEDDTYANFPVNYLKLDKTPGPGRGLEPGAEGAARRQFFVTTGEILITQLRRRRHRRAANDRRGRRMDVPAVVRRGGVGRRQEDGSPGHLGDRSGRLRQQALRDSVRRDGQGVGAIRGVGFGRQRRVRAAGVAECIEGDQRVTRDPRQPAPSGSGRK